MRLERQEINANLGVFLRVVKPGEDIFYYRFERLRKLFFRNDELRKPGSLSLDSREQKLRHNRIPVELPAPL